MSGLAQFLLLGPFFHEGQLVPAPKLYHYLPGTTQEKTAWMDRGKAITAANPIEGDANGLVYGYFSGVYKLVVKTRDGSVTLFQADGVQILDVVDEDVPATVRPEDNNGEASSSVDNTDPITASIADLPAAGGTMQLGPGDYLFSGTLNCGSKNIIFQGVGMDATFLSMTAASNLLHGIVGTGSILLRDLTLRTQSQLTSDQSMYGVRLNLDGTGITGGRRLHVSHCRIDGWNGPIYCDGGSGFGLELASVEHSLVRSGGAPDTHHFGSAVNINRVRNGFIGHNQIDQNNTGEHGIYCFAAQSMLVSKNHIKNATIDECQAIKIVGDGVSSTGQFDRWRVEHTAFESCINGILFGTFGTERVAIVEAENIIGRNIAGSSGVLGGLVTVFNVGASIIDEVLLHGLSGEELGFQAVHLTASGGAKTRHCKIDGLSLTGWGRNNSGTYTAVGVSGSGIYTSVDVLELGTITADGGGDGRTIWTKNAFGGYGTERIGNLKISGTLTETNTTSPEPIPIIEPGVATPDLRFGRKYLLTNPSAQNVTGFENMMVGEEYEFEVTNGNTTLKAGANLCMYNNTDWTPAATDVFKCKASTATAAIESGRSDNT